MKLPIAVALLCLTFAVPAAAADNDEIQQRFLAALSLLQQGRLEEGAALLQDLYARAPTPRIRLELARVLMAQGRLEEAKALFVAAYKDDPPPVVKANILAFIDKIDRQRGKLTLSFSVSRYGNPLQQ